LVYNAMNRAVRFVESQRLAGASEVNGRLAEVVPSDEQLVGLVKYLGVTPGANLSAADEAAQHAIGATEAELADTIREAADRDLISGELGPAGNWFDVAVTLTGLRFAGEWPRTGDEAALGPWREGHWARAALPILRWIQADSPGWVSGLHGSMPEDERSKLATIALLAEAGYLAAEQQDYLAFGDLRLTQMGREVLDPPDRTPVEEAVRRLGNGDKVDAVIHAVEVGLGDRLKALAGANGIIPPPQPDEFHKLTALNDQLGSKTNRVYAETWKATVSAALKLRNEYGHGHGDKMSVEDARSLIDIVAMLLRHLPTP
jgi:hypothetical protein